MADTHAAASDAPEIGDPETDEDEEEEEEQEEKPKRSNQTLQLIDVDDPITAVEYAGWGVAQFGLYRPYSLSLLGCSTRCVSALQRSHRPSACCCSMTRT